MERIMKLQNVFTGAVVLLILAGCATTTGASKPVPVAAKSDSPSRDALFGVLSPRKLAVGECGMFLWSRNTERALVFFGEGRGDARAMIAGQEVNLKRAAVEGREAFGQFESQTYTAGNERLQIDVKFEHRDGMGRGVIIQPGTLTLINSDGWRTVLPVAGIVACYS